MDEIEIRKAQFLDKALKMNESKFREKYKEVVEKADIDVLVYRLTGRVPEWGKD